jgi:hypothetical protein
LLTASCDCNGSRNSGSKALIASTARRASIRLV